MENIIQSAVALAILAVGLLPGCKSAASPARPGGAPTATGLSSAVVYVTDFELGAQDIQREGGLLSGRPGPLGRADDRLSRASADAQWTLPRRENPANGAAGPNRITRALHRPTVYNLINPSRP